MFLDLQFKVGDGLTFMLLIITTFFVLTSGHCLQFADPHFWLSSRGVFVVRCLFLTVVLPIDGFFLIAIIIFVSPIMDFKSVSQSFIICLKDLISLK